MELDELILSMLSNTPKTNSESLRVYTINSCILERLSEVDIAHEKSEEFLIKTLPKSTDDVKNLIKSLKNSNDMINQSDRALAKLFKNLGL